VFVTMLVPFSGYSFSLYSSGKQSTSN